MSDTEDASKKGKQPDPKAARKDTKAFFKFVDRLLAGTIIGPVPDNLRTPEVADLLDAVLGKTYLTDANTNLPAYPRFGVELAKAINKKDGPCTVVYFDFNHLKTLNKKLGIARTDIVVKGIANFLKKELQHDEGMQFKSDANFIGRYKKQGDEFLVIMKGKTKEDATKIMKALQKKLARTDFMYRNPTKPEVRPFYVGNLTITFGCYEFFKGGRADGVASAINIAEEIVTNEKEDRKANHTYPKPPIITNDRRIKDESRDPAHRKQGHEPKHETIDLGGSAPDTPIIRP